MAGPAMAVATGFDLNLLRGHARKRERSSETSSVRSIVPTRTCNTSGTCSARNNGATRAHPDN